MVQEVVSREAELQFLVLGGSPGEVLEQRQVGIKEAWAGQSWEDIAALLARFGKTLEAVPVDVLVRPQVLPWIADHLGHEQDVWGTKYVLAACLDRYGQRLTLERCARRDIGGVVEVGVTATCSLQVCSALILPNAGNLPVVEYAFHQPVLAVDIGNLVDVSEVENMR